MNSINMEWIEKYKVARKIALGVTLWLTAEATLWSIGFAESSGRAGTDIAFIIAAIMGPLTVLQSSVFKLFVSGEHGDVERRTRFTS